LIRAAIASLAGRVTFGASDHI